MEWLTGAAVARATNISPQLLHYWTTTRLVRPTGGKDPAGKRQRWSFDDLLRVAAIVELRRRGASLQHVRQAVAKLMELTGDPLRELRLLVLDREVFVVTDWREGALFRAIDRQASAILLLMTPITERVEAELQRPRSRANYREVVPA